MQFLSLKKTLVFSVIAVFCYGFFVSCENPFSSNLGSKVDVEAPTITVLSPGSGDFLRDTVTFTGEATAYRDLRRSNGEYSNAIQVMILDQNDESTTYLPWTTIGTDIKAHEKKSKTWVWNYNLDTTNFDDTLFLKIKFRVYDESSDPNRKPSETVQLVYVVKNKPSSVKLSSPDQINMDSPENELNPQALVTGMNEIKGQVTDRRGIKPGYPMIKIWPKDEYPDSEPLANDPNWGWASLFLEGRDLDDPLEGFYQDRNEMPVLNVATFVFKLYKFTIDPVTRHIIYTRNGEGNLESLPPGQQYRFRIKTSDTYFNVQGMTPRAPEGEEKETLGYFPSVTEEGDEAAWDKSGPSYVVALKSAAINPTVALENEDITKEILDAEPHYYLTPASMKKIAVGKTGRPDFQLQILAYHPDGISKATLEYRHTAGTNPRRGWLEWDNSPREAFQGPVHGPSQNYVDDTVGTVPGVVGNPTYKAYYGHRGWLKDRESPARGTYFCFTAKGEDPIFYGSSEAYTFVVTVYSTDNAITEQQYTVYLDSRGPSASIRSVRGAANDPTDPGSTTTLYDGMAVGNFGGIVYQYEPYVVNGNIQVVVNREADQGILSAKWKVEEDIVDGEGNSVYLTNPNVLLAKLKAYRSDPSAAGLQFYNDIPEGLLSGKIMDPRKTSMETDDTYNLKFNTWNGPSTGPNAWNGKNLWLYVIAQDGVQNLGFVLQKITVKDDTDKPVMETTSPPNFLPTGPGGINSKEELQVNWDSATFVRRNVLDNDAIELTFTDDDGIDLEKGNITITLVNLADNSNVTLNSAQLKSFLNDSYRRYLMDNNSREWAGVLNQKIMADALYGADRYTKLPDGFYKLSITLSDNKDAKVSIERNPPITPAPHGDEAEAVEITQEYFFVVRSNQPDITIVEPVNDPERNTVMNAADAGALTIAGSVKSGVKIQKLEITFDPALLEANTPASPLDLYSDEGCQTRVTGFGESGRDADGKYVYYWKIPSVNLGTTAQGTTSSIRNFTLKAWDGLAYDETEKCTVEIDTTPPVVSLDLFNFGRELYDEVNGKVPIEIGVYDMGGIKDDNDGKVRLKLWVVRDGVVPTDWDFDPSTAPGEGNGISYQFSASDDLGGGRYLKIINTTDTYFTDGEKYRVFAMAQDAAGNYSSDFERDSSEAGFYAIPNTPTKLPPLPQEPLVFTINQAKDLPEMDEEELRPQNGEYVRNSGTYTVDITGVISDDDGFDPTKSNSYVAIRFPSSVGPAPAYLPTSWTDWIPVSAVSFTTPGTTMKFEYKTAGHSYFAQEGWKYYQIRVSDEPVAGTGLLVQGSPYGNPPGKNPDGINSLEKASQVYPDPEDTNNLTYYSLMLKNGAPEIFFAYYDANHTTGGPDGWQRPSRPAYSNLDRMLANLAGKESLTGETNEHLNGGIWIVEADQVKEAYLYYKNIPVGIILGVDKNNNPVNHLGPKEGDRYPLIVPISELKEWLKNIPFGTNNPNDEGIDTFSIEAIDMAGNSRGKIEWSFYVDNFGPAITSSNVDMTLPESDRIIRADDNDLVYIKGWFRDAYSNVQLTYRYIFNNNTNNDVSTWTPITIPQTDPPYGRTVPWEVPVPLTYADGTHYVRVWAQDMGENATEYRVDFRLDRAVPVVSSTDNMLVDVTGTASSLAEHQRVFSAAYATNAADTNKVFTLSGLVYDLHFNGLTARFYPAAVDLLPVQLPDGILTHNWTDSAYFPADANAQLRVKRASSEDVTKYGGITPNDRNSLVVTAGLVSNVYVWELKVSAGDLYKMVTASPGTGRRELMITAQDRAGHSSVMQQNWYFYLDGDKPTIGFVKARVAPPEGYRYYTTAYSGTTDVTEANSPVRFDVLNDNFSLEGSVQDATNIKEIRYLISKSTDRGTTWNYYGTSAWDGTEANWKVLYPPADDTTQRSTVNWVLDNSKLGAANGYPANLDDGLYKLELYATDYSIAANQANAGNPQNTEVQFFIDRSDPVITWNNNDTFTTDRVSKDYYNSSDLTFYFTAKDGNAIAGYLPAVVRRYGTSTEAGTATVTVTPGTETETGTSKVKVEITGLTDDISTAIVANRYTLSVTARDLSGREAAVNNTLDFYLDNKPPAMAITPSPGTGTVTDSYETVVGRVVLRGSFSKDIARSPVSRVAFALATIDGSGNPSLMPSTADLTDGGLLAAGWYFNDGLESNSDRPRLTNGVNGPTLAQITAGQINANVILPNTRRLNSTSYLGANTTVGTGNYVYNGAKLGAAEIVNKMVVHFLAIDEAGNILPETITYWVYPAGDYPVVTAITSPNESITNLEARLLSGRIRIGGDAVDNVYVKNVWFRVYSNKDLDYAELTIPEWTDTWSESGSNQLHNQNPPGSTSYTGGKWYRANIGSNKSDVSWWAYINTTGELNPATQGGRNTIRVEVVAQDSVLDDSGIDYEANNYLYSSAVRSVQATVVNNAPSFGVEYVRNEASGTTVVGTTGEWSSITSANVRGRAAYAIRIDHSSALAAIRWTQPDGTVINLLDRTPPAAGATASPSYTYNTGTGSGTYAYDLANISNSSSPGIVAKAEQITAGVTAPAVAYWVIIDIDSTNLPGNWAGIAGYYKVNLAAVETSQPIPLISQKEANIPIDNVPPRAYYTHTTNVVGLAPTFGGEAGDIDGAIGSLDKVVLWFSRAIGGTEYVINWDGGAEGTTAFTGVLDQAARNALGIIGLPPETGPGAFANFKMPIEPLETLTAETNISSIIIDRNDPLGSKAHHGHKHHMGFATIGGDPGTSWYVVLDSTKMISGRTTAHYVVYDKAGNASYGSQNLMILNNIPRITRITLGTDIRGDNDLQGTTNLNVSTVNRGISVVNGVYSGGASATRGALDTIRGAFTGAILTDIDKGISDPIAVNTREQKGNYNVVYDEPFNVRNNLLAIQVEIGEAMSTLNDKNRHYSVEHVKSATLRAGANFYTYIRAGNVYMVDSPGVGFPWGLFGAPGDTYNRGFVFLATQSGYEGLLPPTTDPTYGGAAVYELTTVTGAGVVPSVQYPSTVTTTSSGPGSTNGKIAEFVYGTSAFGTTETTIIDFDQPTLDDSQRPYPYLRNVTPAWTPWTAYSLFIVRVYDADESNPTPTDDDRLFGDFALLSIRVNNNDQTPPFAQLYDLNPKAELQTEVAVALDPQSMGANRTKGGLWASTDSQQAIVKSGHIEPRGGTGLAGTSLTNLQMGGAASSDRATIYNPQADAGAYFTIDTVSGEVILRGYAQDDQRIGRIDLQFGLRDAVATNANTVTILHYNGKSAGTSLIGVPTAVAETGVAIALADRVSFTETIDLNRHRVEWAYLWDSQTLPTGTGAIVGDNNVRVVVYTNSTLANNNARKQSVELARSSAVNTNFNILVNGEPYFNPSFTNNLEKYNRITVNLRPYITGFVRNKNLLAHDTRSRQGWYMLARNEVAVIKGFNLGGVVTPQITFNGVTVNVVTAAGDGGGNNGVLSAPGDFGLSDAPASRYRIFTVPADATTGDGIVTYSTTAAAGGGTRYFATNADTIPLLNGTPGTTPRKIQPWNTERSPGVEGSELWDDFTRLHIWQSNNSIGATDSGNFRSSGTDNWPIMNPAMTINPRTGVLYASHNENGSVGNGGTLRASTNDGTREGTDNPRIDGTAVSSPLIQFVDPIVYSDIYRSPGGGANFNNPAPATWAVSSIIGQGGDYNSWHNVGGIYISGQGGGTIEFAPTGNPVNGPYYTGESTWYDATSSTTGQSTDRGSTKNTIPRYTDQFANPHIITSYTAEGGTEHIHVSYYDTKDGSIKYRYNQRGQPYLRPNNQNISSNNGNGQTRDESVAVPKVWTNLDGGYDVEDTDALAATGPFPQVNQYYRVVNYGSSGTGTTARPATRINAGEHNAIAVTSGGFPVIAYYDASNQKLKLAVSGNIVPVAARHWFIRDNVIDTTDPNHFGTGQFVSIAIDTKVTPNIIHMAAMNTNGNLVYIRGTLRPAESNTSATTYTATEPTGGVLSGVTTQVIDSNGTVGRWCKISLDSAGHPWIAYQDTGYMGSRDGVKLAYLNATRFTKGAATFAGKDIDRNGKNISGWETMHVPTAYRVENPIVSIREHGRIGLECFPTRNVAAATANDNKFWGAAVSYHATYPENRYRVAYYVK